MSTDGAFILTTAADNTTRLWSIAHGDVVAMLQGATREINPGAFSPDGTYVPRTIFYTSEGDVMKDVAGKDPEYPHTIDLDDPTELRTLMQKAAARTSPPPSSEPDRRAQN